MSVQIGTKLEPFQVEPSHVILVRRHKASRASVVLTVGAATDCCAISIHRVCDNVNMTYHNKYD